MRYILLTCILFFSLAFRFGSSPQLDERDTNSMIKANYLYNFAKLVGWPDKKAKGNFVVGVLGDPSLYQQMIKRYADKSIGSQPMEIIQLLGTEQVGDMHMLFVSRSMDDQVAKVVEQTSKKGTMIVTESPGSLNKGAHINIVVVDNRLKFDIHESNASTSGLVIANTLRSLANNLVK